MFANNAVVNARRLTLVLALMTMSLGLSALSHARTFAATTTLQSLTTGVLRVGLTTSVGTASLQVTDDGPLATGTLASSRLSLPAGVYDVSSCLGTTPASASIAQPCATETVTIKKGQTLLTRSTSLTAYRPVDATTQVAMTAVINVRLHVGTSTILYATSWIDSVANSLLVHPLTATPAYQQDRGSNVHLFKPGVTLQDLAADLDALKAAGATMVRTAFPWALLQPQNTPQFDAGAVAEVDGFLQLAHDRGIKVLAIFGSTPCWTSSAPATVKGGCTSSLGDWDRYPTVSAATLQAAAKEFGARWGNELAGVEYWNEPNNSQFFAGTASTYVALLKIFYPALKSTAPHLPVIAGALSLSDTTFLQAMYKAGARGYYDALSVHPYQVVLGSTPATSDPALAWPAGPTSGTFATGVQSIRKLMTANGDAATPLWITEFGFSTCTTASAVCVTPDQQSTFLSESFAMAARWANVPVVLSYLTRDPAADGTWTDSFGMLNNDTTAKPSFAGVAQSWACLADGTC